MYHLTFTDWLGTYRFGVCSCAYHFENQSITPITDGCDRQAGRTGGRADKRAGGTGGTDRSSGRDRAALTVLLMLTSSELLIVGYM